MDTAAQIERHYEGLFRDTLAEPRRPAGNWRRHGLRLPHVRVEYQRSDNMRSVVYRITETSTGHELAFVHWCWPWRRHAAYYTPGRALDASLASAIAEVVIHADRTTRPEGC